MQALLCRVGNVADAVGLAHGSWPPLLAPLACPCCSPLSLPGVAFSLCGVAMRCHAAPCLPNPIPVCYQLSLASLHLPFPAVPSASRMPLSRRTPHTLPTPPGPPRLQLATVLTRLLRLLLVKGPSLYVGAAAGTEDGEDGSPGSEDESADNEESEAEGGGERAAAGAGEAGLFSEGTAGGDATRARAELPLLMTEGGAEAEAACHGFVFALAWALRSARAGWLGVRRLGRRRALWRGKANLALPRAAARAAHTTPPRGGALNPLSNLPTPPGAPPCPPSPCAPAATTTIRSTLP